MSAKNRGSKVIENEFYPTPKWLIEPILPHVIHNYKNILDILEPACGTGNIVNCILDHASINKKHVNIDFFDIDPKVESAVKQDFLTFETDKRYELIITNPPFSLAMEFAKKGLTLLKSGGKLCLLLRINWLGSQERAKWLRENTPSIYVTPKRPKFRLNKNGKWGSDATEYAWFVWENGSDGWCKAVSTINILPTEYIDG